MLKKKLVLPNNPCYFELSRLRLIVAKRVKNIKIFFKSQFYYLSNQNHKNESYLSIFKEQKILIKFEIKIYNTLQFYFL